MISTENCVVLAGGGVAGIAWETGFLLGLQDQVPSLAQRVLTPTTTLIGTSAGSTVAAQLAAGRTLESLFDLQVAATTSELGVAIDFAELAATLGAAMTDVSSPEEARRRLGRLARTSDTPPTQTRRAVIEARLDGHDWTDWPLLVTAVDADSGDLRIFDRTSGPSLVEVVAASCAVPGVWPPVEIDGHVYMDGGTRSVANADLAAGALQVLILVPSAAQSAFGPSVSDDELQALAPARTHVVHADATSLESMGVNPLDPASRIPAARAGRDQGRRLAAEIDAFWH